MNQKLFLTTILGLAVTPALAADANKRWPAPTIPPVLEAKSDWTIDVGAGAVIAPKFVGSKRSRAMPVPFFALNHKDIVFASVADGLGVNIVNAYGFKAGPVLKVAFPRLQRDDKRYLRGLTDVDATLESGGFVSYTPNPFISGKIEMRKGLASLGGGKRNSQLAAIGIQQRSKGHEGFVADLSADFSLPPLFNDRVFISGGPRLSYFDKSYARTYFGVSAAEAVVSTFNAYNPKGGVGKVGVGVAALVSVTEKVSLTAFGDYGRFVGDVAKSPIVRGKDGSRDQFTVGTGLTYRFGI